MDDKNDTSQLGSSKPLVQLLLHWWQPVMSWNKNKKLSVLIQSFANRLKVKCEKTGVAKAVQTFLCPEYKPFIFNSFSSMHIK